MATDPPLGEVFSAGANEFVRWNELLWSPMGEATVARARPAAGAKVFDACCGAGASALPAARAVGPGGVVHAVDLADGLLKLGRQAAAAESLSWLEFTEADVTTWPAPAGGYDLVLCVYGVFFLPDMDAGTAHLASLLAPGGRLAVTTWTTGGMTPLSTLLAETVNEVNVDGEPVRAEARGAWQRISTPELCAEWLRGMGLADVTVHQVSLSVPMDGDLAWALVLGTGMRRMLARLTEPQRQQVRERFTEALVQNGLDTFTGDSLIAVAIGTHH